MDKFWRYDWFRFRFGLVLVWCLLHQNLSCGWSLNDEGLALLRFRERIIVDPYSSLSSWKDSYGEKNPCSWFGVECSDGNVVVLNLKDLCLGGTLTSELRKLVHIKSIVLRNNSFFGAIPIEIGHLKELEMMDLGYNKFSGPLPANLGNNLSLTFLLLDNNQYLHSVCAELHELDMLSQLQVDDDLSYAQEAFDNRKSISWTLMMSYCNFLFIYLCSSLLVVTHK